MSDVFVRCKTDCYLDVHAKLNGVSLSAIIVHVKCVRVRRVRVNTFTKRYQLLFKLLRIIDWIAVRFCHEEFVMYLAPYGHPSLGSF